jgi:hypothetical protein
VHCIGCPCRYRALLPREAGYNHGWLMILNCRLEDDVLSRPAILLKPIDLETDRFIWGDLDTLLIVRSINGKPGIEPWGSKPLTRREARHYTEMNLGRSFPFIPALGFHAMIAGLT